MPSKGRQREAPPHTPAYSPQPAASSSYPHFKEQPFEAQQRSFDPDNDADMVDDPAISRMLRSQPDSLKNVEKNRGPNRTSAISKEVDPAGIMNRILNIPFTISVGELFGVSKEVSQQLQNVLKVKKVEAAPGPAANLVSGFSADLVSGINETRSPLIRLTMDCNDKPVNFIIDTGSQLNIISEKIWKSIVQRPMDKSRAISINDANGGTGDLLGLVSDVPLKFGHISTKFNAYVAPNPPFEGLLGRPWQRTHGVGIRERDEGTFLTFRGPPGHPNSEVFISSHEDIGSAASFTTIIDEKATDSNQPQTSARIESVDDDPGECGEESIDDEEYDPDSEDVDSDSDKDDIDPDEDSDMEGLASEFRRITIKRKTGTSRLDTMYDHKTREMALYQSLLTAQMEDYRASLTRKIGANTLVADSGIEFLKNDPGNFGPQIFLIRDAQFFFEDSHCNGHAIVQLYPYSKKNMEKLGRLLRRPVDTHLMMLTAEGLKPDVVPQVAQFGPTCYDGLALGPWSYLDPMIVIHMHAGSTTIPFVVDTGSQIDCINANVWKSANGTNREIGKEVTIRDVSGKPMPCIGAWDVALSIGHVETQTTLYIIEGLAVPGLLG
ncbi:hypothetical protein A0H81_11430 [Grifola frondosa]|uniref:DUF4100 domain-containing protein n=1 Tax=Grifola frondosa TaxID=5627 RepID=A0A1C7LUE9_GRIFR|nr:hypothetical protein A0H81_11430 [Grifola frondosa]